VNSQVAAGGARQEGLGDALEKGVGFYIARDPKPYTLNPKP